MASLGLGWIRKERLQRRQHDVLDVIEARGEDIVNRPIRPRPRLVAKRKDRSAHRLYARHIATERCSRLVKRDGLRTMRVERLGQSNQILLTVVAMDNQLRILLIAG